MFDIKRLRVPYVQKAEANDLIDAQLAMALWGVVDWVIEDGTPGWGYLAEALTQALEQANIERPSSRAAAQ